MDDKIMRIGIVGGGAGGNHLLQVFSHSKKVAVAYLADTNPNAPGMETARTMGIKTLTNVDSAVKGEPVDYVVDTTSSQDTRQAIQRNLTQGEILSGPAAMLFYEVFQEHRVEVNRQVFADLNAVREEIDKNTRDVSKTLHGIEKISNELEVLAINAGIQASRAAQFGKGFAVVAGEVKSTARVARDLAGDIDRIMGEIASMSRKIEQSLQRIQ